jgi:glycosyltransferase involved in cell wall biosynthesis
MPMHERGGRHSARYPHLFDPFFVLARRLRHMDMCVPLLRDAPEREEYGPVEIGPGVEVVALPHWTSAKMVVRRAHAIVPASLRIVRRRMAGWDVVGAVVPSVVGTVFVVAARARRRPVFLLVRGEKQRTVTWIMGRRLSTLPYLLALKAMDAAVRRWIAAGVPAFVAGQELVERYDAPGARVHNLYPGLSSDFPIREAPRAGAAEPGVLRCVTVARLSREKGLDDLLRAAALARAGGAGVEVTLVGDGPDREALGALAAELGLGDAVRLAGFVPHGPELVAALDAADVFVLPSRSEGLPHSIVEAMARGLPVVGSAVGGIPELLRDGGGVVVPPGDPASLARELATLAGDQDRLAELSAASLERSRRFTPEHVAREMTRLLAEAYPALSRLPAR